MNTSAPSDRLKMQYGPAGVRTPVWPPDSMGVCRWAVGTSSRPIAGKSYAEDSWQLTNNQTSVGKGTQFQWTILENLKIRAEQRIA